MYKSIISVALFVAAGSAFSFGVESTTDGNRDLVGQLLHFPSVDGEPCVSGEVEFSLTDHTDFDWDGKTLRVKGGQETSDPWTAGLYVTPGGPTVNVLCGMNPSPVFNITETREGHPVLQFNGGIWMGCPENVLHPGTSSKYVLGWAMNEEQIPKGCSGISSLYVL